MSVSARKQLTVLRGLGHVGTWSYQGRERGSVRVRTVALAHLSLYHLDTGQVKVKLRLGLGLGCGV